MSASLTSISSRSNARIDSSRITVPGHDRGRAVGMEAGDSPALVDGERGELGRDALARAAVEPVAVHPVRVVGVELEVDRGERRWRCRRRRCRARRVARTSAGTSRLQTLAAPRRPAPPAPRSSAGRCAGGARCGGPSPCGWRRGSRGRRPAVPTTYSVLPPPMSITRASASPSAGPLVAPRKVSRASSSPEMVRGLDAEALAQISSRNAGRSRRRAWRWWRPRRRPRRRGGRCSSR